MSGKDNQLTVTWQFMHFVIIKEKVSRDESEMKNVKSRRRLRVIRVTVPAYVFISSNFELWVMFSILKKSFISKNAKHATMSQHLAFYA